jgi:hypothetical protein
VLSHTPLLAASGSLCSSSQTCIPTAISTRSQRLLIAWLTLCLWRWRQYVPPKRRWTSTRIHGATCQRTVYLSPSWSLNHVREKGFLHKEPVLRFVHLTSLSQLRRLYHVYVKNHQEWWVRKDIKGIYVWHRRFGGTCRLHLATCFHVGFLLGVFFDLKMETSCCSETSVDFQRTTRRYIPEHRTLNLLRGPGGLRETRQTWCDM